MGLMQKLRSLFGSREHAECDEKTFDVAQLHQWMIENRHRQEKYLTMENSKLGELPENELLQAVQFRAEHRVDACGLEDAEQLAGFLQLPASQQIVYVLYQFENEMQNGGLCQFFVNSSRMVAPYVSQSLNAVGAEEHQQLFDDFISEHEIDLDDLSSFVSEDEEAFEAQYDRYPFEEFDEAFCALESLEHYMRLR